MAIAFVWPPLAGYAALAFEPDLDDEDAFEPWLGMLTAGATCNAGAGSHSQRSAISNAAP
jgi:hypothetical protein